MGAFDDLVPKGGAKPKAAPKQQSGNAFADLIPAGGAPRRAVQKREMPRAREYNPTDEMSGWERFLAGAGKSVVDTVQGAKQSFVDASDRNVGTASSALRAIGADGAANMLTRNVGIPLHQKSQQLRAEEQERRTSDAALMRTGAGLGGNIAGNVAQMAAGGIGLRSTSLASAVLPRTVTGNALLGAAQGAMQPVVSDRERVMNTAIGAGTGATLAKAGEVLRAAGGRAKDAISDQARTIYQAAKARGITLTPSQVSDSRFMKWMASHLRDMPLTGAMQRAEQQIGQWNRKVAETIGEDAPFVNSEVFSRAKARQSATFEDLTSRNALQVNDQLMRRLTNIENSARIDTEAHSAVQNALDRLFEQSTTGANGVVIPGPAYQAFDSALGQITKKGGVVAQYVGQVQQAVRKAMDRSIDPADRAAWAQVRREYGNRKTIEPLVAKAADEPLSPPQLMSAVTNSRWAKAAMAEGRRGELGELAKIGQRMKGPANSGTAPRQEAKEWFDLGRLPFKIASLPVGATAGRFIDSEALTAYLMRENPGLTRKAAGELLQRLAPVGGGLAARDTNEASRPPQAGGLTRTAAVPPRGGR